MRTSTPSSRAPASRKRTTSPPATVGRDPPAAVPNPAGAKPADRTIGPRSGTSPRGRAVRRGRRWRRGPRSTRPRRTEPAPRRLTATGARRATAAGRPRRRSTRSRSGSRVRGAPSRRDTDRRTRATRCGRRRASVAPGHTWGPYPKLRCWSALSRSTSKSSPSANTARRGSRSRCRRRPARPVRAAHRRPTCRAHSPRDEQDRRAHAQALLDRVRASTASSARAAASSPGTVRI